MAQAFDANGSVYTGPVVECRRCNCGFAVTNPGGALLYPSPTTTKAWRWVDWRAALAPPTTLPPGAVYLPPPPGHAHVGPPTPVYPAGHLIDWSRDIIEFEPSRGVASSPLYPCGCSKKWAPNHETYCSEWARYTP